MDFQIFVTFKTVINLLEGGHILNRQIPDLQVMFIDQMKKSCFSIATDRSNDKSLKHAYPICLYPSKSSTVISICVYPSKSSTVISIFETIDTNSD